MDITMYIVQDALVTVVALWHIIICVKICCFQWNGRSMVYEYTESLFIRISNDNMSYVIGLV